MYALCVDRASAAEELRLAAGDTVTLERADAPATPATTVRIGRRDGVAR